METRFQACRSQCLEADLARIQLQHRSTCLARSELLSTPTQPLMATGAGPARLRLLTGLLFVLSALRRSCCLADEDVRTAAKEWHPRPSCHGFRRKIRDGLTVCPVMNGVWTSFQDHSRWGGYDQKLTGAVARQLAMRMEDPYEEMGMNVWIGEDFDARVMSLLRAHRRRQRHKKQQQRTALQATDNSSTSVLAGGAKDGSSNSLYSIIIEMPERLEAGVKWMAEEMGENSVTWVQVGPPALNHKDLLKRLHDDKRVLHVGVEDYDYDMLLELSEAVPITTVQQEINLLVRPSARTHAFCYQTGCQFVAYGALLGGFLSNKYLGMNRPTPDAQHSKQIDYLGSIDQWGDWRSFQALLSALDRVAKRHDATIAQIALKFTLDLPFMAGAIVGVRLGVEGDSANHAEENLRALEILLSDKDKDDIVLAIGFGHRIDDGLART